MNNQRHVISDGLWQRIAPLLPGKATDGGTLEQGPGAPSPVTSGW